MELWRLLAHEHWFTVRTGGLELRLCARCSGYVVGLSSLTVLSSVFGLAPFKGIPMQYQLLLCLLLVMPFALDWLTQSWGLRESSNNLRFVTGAIVGIDVILFSSADISSSLKTLIPLSAAFMIVTFGFLAHVRKQRRLRLSLG